MSDGCYQATPHAELMSKLMDQCAPKTELEWAAGREVSTLRDRAEAAERDLAEANEAIRLIVRLNGESILDDCISPAPFDPTITLLGHLPAVRRALEER